MITAAGLFQVHVMEDRSANLLHQLPVDIPLESRPHLLDIMANILKFGVELFVDRTYNYMTCRP